MFGDALQVLYQMSVPKNAAAARIVKEVPLICNCDNDVDVASVFFFGKFQIRSVRWGVLAGYFVRY